MMSSLISFPLLISFSTYQAIHSSMVQFEQEEFKEEQYDPRPLQQLQQQIRQGFGGPNAPMMNDSAESTNPPIHQLLLDPQVNHHPQIGPQSQLNHNALSEPRGGLGQIVLNVHRNENIRHGLDDISSINPSSMLNASADSTNPFSPQLLEPQVNHHPQIGPQSQLNHNALSEPRGGLGQIVLDVDRRENIRHGDDDISSINPSSEVDRSQHELHIDGAFLFSQRKVPPQDLGSEQSIRQQDFMQKMESKKEPSQKSSGKIKRSLRSLKSQISQRSNGTSNGSQKPSQKSSGQNTHVQLDDAKQQSLYDCLMSLCCKK